MSHLPQGNTGEEVDPSLPDLYDTLLGCGLGRIPMGFDEIDYKPALNDLYALFKNIKAWIASLLGR